MSSEGNPFVGQETFTLSEQQATKNYERSYKSPIFHFRNTATISALGRFLFDFHRDNTRTEKYGSFNNVVISNNSSSAILVYPSQDLNQGIFIPAGQEKVITGAAIGAVASLLVEELDSSSITAGKIRVVIWKDLADIDTIAQRIHRTAYDDKEGSINKIAEFLRSVKKADGVI